MASWTELCCVCHAIFMCCVAFDAEKRRQRQFADHERRLDTWALNQ